MPSNVPSNEFEGRPELVQKRARTIMLYRALIAVGLIYVFVTVTLVSVGTIIGFQTRSELLDCTTPTGDCYRDSQEQAARFLEQLYQEGLNREGVTRRIIVFAAACAQDATLNTVPEIEKCVNEQLEKAGDSPLP